MRCAIGVGSNRGDRRAWVQRAEELLMQAGIQVVATAPWITSEPVGGPAGQEAFLNGAWVVKTSLGHHSLLHAMQCIETACGRTRTVRWGSRTIDLDLLLDDQGSVISTPVLTLPHPLLHLRPFVLQPLSYIAGGWVHPLLGKSIAALASSL